jgi:DNA-binding CsgD family transcriptional regulator
LRLVERQGVVAHVDRFLASIGDGPHGLVLRGEPGIGKTSVVQATLTRADGTFNTLSCRPAHAERDLAFVTLADLFDEVEPDIFDELPPAQREALRIALLLDEPGMHPPDRATIAAATAGMLAALARIGRVLVVIDDAHWLDGPSATVLAEALGALRNEPVAVVVACRPDGWRFDSWVPGIPHDVIDLDPLSEDGLAGLLVDRYPPGFGAPTTQRIHEACGGNPLFGLEIGRLLHSRGGILRAREELPLPSGLSGLLDDRIGMASAGARRLLLLVSLAGRVARAELERLDPQDDIAPSAREAIGAGLVEEEGAVLVPAHPLIATAARSSIADEERRWGHRVLARILEDRDRAAWHLGLGTSGTSAEVAEPLERAGRRARLRGAPEVAMNMLELAADLTPADATGNEGWRRRVEAAEAASTAHDVNRLRTLLDTSLPACPPGSLRARLLQLSADLESSHGGSEAKIREALQEAEGDLTLEARLLLALASSLFVQGDLESTLAALRSAADRVPRISDRSLGARVLATLAYMTFFHGDGPDTDLFETALEHEHGVAAPSVTSSNDAYLSPHTLLGCVLMWVGQLDAAHVHLMTAAQRAMDLGDRPSYLGISLHLVERDCRAGELETSIARAEVLHDRYVRDRLANYPAVLGYSRALAESHLGRMEQARVHGRDALEAARALEDRVFMAQASCTLGALEVSVGDHTAALPHLQLARELTDGIGIVEPNVIPSLPEEIEALIGLSRTDEARALLERLEAVGRRLDRHWAIQAAARCRALLDGADGEFHGALDTANRATELQAAFPDRHPLEEGRAYLVLGVTQRRARRRQDARVSILEALEIFEGIRAGAWAKRARDELDRLAPRRSSSPLTLTAAERRVAELVVTGLSNRETAARLKVSVHTIESHLSHVYTKLQIATRNELRRRLLDEPGR